MTSGTGLTPVPEWIFSGFPALTYDFSTSYTKNSIIRWRLGVSLSTASSMDVQGVYQPIACSADGRAGFMYLFSPYAGLSGIRSVRMNKNANPGTTAWPKINLFLFFIFFTILVLWTVSSLWYILCICLLFYPSLLSHLTLSRPFSLFLISKFIPFPRVCLTS